MFAYRYTPSCKQAENGGTVFDRGAETGAPGANAFDGVNVLNGAELMPETGSLRFVVGLKALAAGYDANGNMTLRLKDGVRYFLAYDAENRLTVVSGTVSASFAYNGDGQRVTSTIGTAAITTYIGGYFEWKDGVGTSYYFAGAQRVAMRASTGVEFLLGDHLGSTSLTVNSLGGNPRELRYYPWGEVRWASGTTPTDYRFTGQMEVASIGLYFYNARWYDSSLGRFVQADTIIPNPGNPVAWDRFAYTANNPVKYVDPSGHHYCDSEYADPEECAGLDAYGDGYLDPRTPKPTYYDCTPLANKPCLTQQTDPITQLAHVIFGEGGSSLYQAGVNVTQTILNRAYNYWTCGDDCLHSWINPGHIPWEQITEEQLLALLLFIVSEPYLGKDGVLYPVYNAWGAPYSHPRTGEYGGEVFSAIITMLGNILNNPGLAPSAAPVVLNVYGTNYRPYDVIRNSTAVMYYGSAAKTAWGGNKPLGWVASDTWTAGGITYIQYYGIYPIDPP